VQPLTDILVFGIQGNISALTYVAHISSMVTKIAQLVLLLQTVEEYLEECPIINYLGISKRKSKINNRWLIINAYPMSNYLTFNLKTI